MFEQLQVKLLFSVDLTSLGCLMTCGMFISVIETISISSLIKNHLTCLKHSGPHCVLYHMLAQTHSWQALQRWKFKHFIEFRLVKGTLIVLLPRISLHFRVTSRMYVLYCLVDRFYFLYYNHCVTTFQL